MTRTIDLNVDLGEDPASHASGRDEAIASCVTSINVACGGHAGDEGSMRAIARIARRLGVSIGAHPGYPDRAGFGRVGVRMAMDALEASIEAQVCALAAAARGEGIMLTHVKPHGALYHDALAREDVAEAVARAGARVDPSLVLVGMGGSVGIECWRRAGFRVAREGFADRRYDGSGRLLPRSDPRGVITDPAEAASQAVEIAQHARARADGGWVRIEADTLGVHGDTPGAENLVVAVRRALEGAGVVVRRLGEVVGGPAGES